MNRTHAFGRRFWLGALALSLLITALPGDARAQRTSSSRTTTPEQTAKEMFEKRASADDVATKLLSDRVSADETLRILSVVGYRELDVARAAVGALRMPADAAAGSLRKLDVSAKAVASALAGVRVSVEGASRALHSAGFETVRATEGLVTGFEAEPFEAFEALQIAGFQVTELSRAVEELGIPVDLDCVGPDGQPAPCGNFGQGGNTPAMGQVTVSPSSAAGVGEEVTFQSTNIPAVDVLLDGDVLEVIEMTPSRVRARLPSSQTSGQLAFRRVSDGVVGVLVERFEVIEVVEDEYAGLDWDAIAEAAREGAMSDMDMWVMTARFDSSRCRIDAAVAIGDPGVLQGSGGFQGGIKTGLRLAGAPDELAEAWQEAFESAFREWADNVTIPGLPWYPGLAAFPGPHAPPMPNVPTPLASLISGGVLAMSPPSLTGRLNRELPRSDVAEEAIASFANDVGASFGVFLGAAQVMLVMGGGPVPAFNPPGVPVGPVQGGTCFSNGMWTPMLPSGTEVTLPDIG